MTWSKSKGGGRVEVFSTLQGRGLGCLCCVGMRVVQMATIGAVMSVCCLSGRWYVQELQLCVRWWRSVDWLVLTGLS